uniref:Uncharacterized protein n=1 Tax=Trypanosoma vivax (strain Y486) TaxID=1055687 RepID=G0TV67_TRYVY|nr:conserved hypothetical protein [Trypanosoma vivax Y486]
MHLQNLFREESFDVFEGANITATRRTWLVNMYGDCKRFSTVGASIDGSNVAATNSGISSEANMLTPSDDNQLLCSRFTPLTQSPQRNDARRECVKRQRSGRAPSTDFLWEEELVTEGQKADQDHPPRFIPVTGTTPSTVCARIRCPADCRHTLSPDAVRRRLSLHEGIRSSHEGYEQNANDTSEPLQFRRTAVASINATTAAQVTPASTPLNHGYLQLLPEPDPPTESRAAPRQSGADTPSSCTPLWTAPENEDGERVELENEDEFSRPYDDEDDIIARLPLGRRPSSFSKDTVLAVRLAEESGADEQHIGAQKWIEDTKNFFKKIDERPLLALSVD